MADEQNRSEFTGALYREGKRFVSLCLDLDVASQGRTAREARRMLAEAVRLSAVINPVSVLTRT